MAAPALVVRIGKLSKIAPYCQNPNANMVAVEQKIRNYSDEVPGYTPFFDR